MNKTIKKDEFEPRKVTSFGMTYDLIDEDALIGICSAMDLSEQRQEEFLNANKGYTIYDFTVAYDSETGVIVVNKDHNRFEDIISLAIDYPFLPYPDRVSIVMTMRKEKSPLVSILSFFEDVVMKRHNIPEYVERVYEKEFRIIGKSKAAMNEMDMLSAICTEKKLSDGEEFTKICLAYSWGFIKGQRTERAKRKGVETKLLPDQLLKRLLVRMIWELPEDHSILESIRAYIKDKGFREE